MKSPSPHANQSLCSVAAPHHRFADALPLAKGRILLLMPSPGVKGFFFFFFPPSRFMSVLLGGLEEVFKMKIALNRPSPKVEAGKQVG